MILLYLKKIYDTKNIEKIIPRINNIPEILLNLTVKSRPGKNFSEFAKLFLIILYALIAMGKGNNVKKT